MPKEANITFRLPSDEKEQLRAYCEEKDMPMSQLIRQAIKEFLNKNR